MTAGNTLTDLILILNEILFLFSLYHNDWTFHSSTCHISGKPWVYPRLHISLFFFPYHHISGSKKDDCIIATSAHTERRESIYVPNSYYKSIFTPHGTSLSWHKKKITMHYNNLTLNRHSYKVVKHIHINTIEKGYYFKQIYKTGTYKQHIL